MSYISFMYYGLVALAVLLYYIFPKKIRWIVLLLGSGAFYYFATKDYKQIAVLLASVIIGYVGGLVLSKNREKKGAIVLLWVFVVLSLGPLVAIRLGDLAFVTVLRRDRLAWIIPLGLSFYSLQLVAYLADIYKGKNEAQKNPFKFTLFMTFFPQIVQGPIPRYENLSEELFEGNQYEFNNLVRGLIRLGWGFFLKYMIADKSAIVVNTVFDHPDTYMGAYVWVGAVLYSIQLYTDFYSCVEMARGVAELFGIHLGHNFEQPYFSTSVKEFWRRWHISFSSWLKDYIYIPLGGNRNGKAKKYLNVFLTFLASGFWHGGSIKYIVWGVLHAIYQILEDLLKPIGGKLYSWLRIPQGSKLRRFLGAFLTFFFVMIAWIIFRADSFAVGLSMIKSMFTHFNPWILFDSSLTTLGLGWQEWTALGLSFIVLVSVSVLREKKKDIISWIMIQHVVIRFVIYFAFIWSIWIFGTYGYGFDAASFIYGGF